MATWVGVTRATEVGSMTTSLPSPNVPSPPLRCSRTVRALTVVLSKALSNVIRISDAPSEASDPGVGVMATTRGPGTAAW